MLSYTLFRFILPFSVVTGSGLLVYDVDVDATMLIVSVNVKVGANVCDSWCLCQVNNNGIKRLHVNTQG